jgi:protein involved in polysaccharide export with SLBB domain
MYEVVEEADVEFVVVEVIAITTQLVEEEDAEVEVVAIAM